MVETKKLGQEKTEWIERKIQLEKTEWIERKIHLEIQAKKLKRHLKNQSGIAAWEHEATSEKANFCSNTVFSLYFKFRATKFHAAKPRAFSLHFLFRRDQNHTATLT